MQITDMAIISSNQNPTQREQNILATKKYGNVEVTKLVLYPLGCKDFAFAKAA
jgi:hypothetical protein